MELKTSVVITTKDRLSLLRRCVHAAQHDPATSEIVIVDDASTDATARWLKSGGFRGPPVRSLRLGGVGPGAAREAGVEHASGDIVVLLDDDVVGRPGLVSGHRALLEGKQARVSVGYSPIWLPARRRPSDVARFVYARDYERRCARYRLGPAPVLHNLWGGNVGLWREAALAVGVRSPHFDGPHAFHEDRDFGLRALRAGLHGVFDPGLAADHHHRRSVAAALDDAERRGASVVRLHRLHADLIGPWDPDMLFGELPAVAAAGVRLMRRPRVGRTVLPMVWTAIEASGRLRRWSAQSAAFKLARRVREQQGALAVQEPV